MTQLQRLAIQHIAKIAHGMDIECPRRKKMSHETPVSDEEIEKLDTASQDRWYKNTKSRSSIDEWTSALLKERDDA
jgi:hypothetical protein